ncbi:MFS transporter [Mycolicibacterium vaccae]|uniref:Major facilitator superfamily protein n=1 Tax=Mycolicibacterium vaccae ATCC 25954 TaxID=1194972 RepID=K0V1L4_MYCVA|nr:MFS transporter [Mycolicibacterium vaccae]ANI41433.1 MFS transporter [Mycolicibacterium vaccae 95051]EJZ04869.1 major facilitator superfamily protein [Mycolicibacterium vaccae ATCC 25954]MCV7064067.1 MFS transporter [Mycolicibacterium vaccae]
MSASATPTRRRDFALLTYVLAAIMLGATLPTPMYDLYGQQLHFSVLTTTVIFAVYAGGVLGALLLFGRWSDVVGRRPMLLAAALLAIGSSVVFLAADSVTALLVGRVLSGLSVGIATGTATAAILESAPPRWRTRAAAVATLANLGALGLGPMVAGALIQFAPAPLHTAFVVHIVLMTIAVPAIAMTGETAERGGRLSIQRLSLPPQTRSVFAVAATAAFAGFAVNAMFTSVAPTFVTTLMGVQSHAVAGVVAGLTVLTAGVVQPAAVRVAPSRAIAIGSAVLIVAMVMLLAAVKFSSLWGLVVAAIVAGMGQGLSFGRGLAAVAERTPPDRRAEVSSSYFLVAYIALSLPIVAMGAAARSWGLQAAGEVFAIVIGVLALICFVAIVIQERRDRSGSST